MASTAQLHEGEETADESEEVATTEEDSHSPELVPTRENKREAVVSIQGVPSKQEKEEVTRRNTTQHRKRTLSFDEDEYDNDKELKTTIEEEEILDKEIRGHIWNMANAWEEGMERLAYTSQLREEERWNIIKAVWKTKSVYPTEEMEHASWLSFKDTMAAKSQYNFLRFAETQKAELITQITETAWAITKGTVSEAKQWVAYWRNKNMDRWGQCIADMTARRDVEMGEVTYADWVSEELNAWLAKEKKDYEVAKEIQIIHQLVVEQDNMENETADEVLQWSQGLSHDDFKEASLPPSL